MPFKVQIKDSLIKITLADFELLIPYFRFPQKGSGGLITATAMISPVLFGWLLDLGVPVTAIVAGGIVLTMLVSVLAFLASDPSKRTDLHSLSTITSK